MRRVFQDAHLLVFFISLFVFLQTVPLEVNFVPEICWSDVDHRPRLPFCFLIRLLYTLCLHPPHTLPPSLQKPTSQNSDMTTASIHNPSFTIIVAPLALLAL